MVFINETDVIGVIILNLNTNVTGSIFMTGLLIIILLMASAMAFRIPIEYSVLVVIPLLLVLMTYSSDFMAIGGLFLMYLAVIFAKMWMNK